ncbi:hypothetical protein VTO73DRAFT_106 [Trametes versicolor]
MCLVAPDRTLAHLCSICIHPRHSRLYTHSNTCPIIAPHVTTNSRPSLTVSVLAYTWLIIYSVHISTVCTALRSPHPHVSRIAHLDSLTARTTDIDSPTTRMTNRFAVHAPLSRSRPAMPCSP